MGEAPKAEEPPEVVTGLQNRSGGSTPRDKEEIDKKIARAEERRKEYLDSKLESVRHGEERRAEVLNKQKDDEMKFIEQTKKKLEAEYTLVEQNKESQRKLFEQSRQEREARIEETKKRASEIAASGMVSVSCQ